MAARRRLGGRLLEQGILDQAPELQKTTGRKLGTVLMQEGLLSEEVLLDFLRRQLDVDVVTSAHRVLDGAARRRVSEALIRRYPGLLLEIPGRELTLARADSFNPVALDVLRFAPGGRGIQVVLAAERTLASHLQKRLGSPGLHHPLAEVRRALVRGRRPTGRWDLRDTGPMRLALLQLNARLGDPGANGHALEAAYASAVAAGAELVLTPELAIPGYLAEDRLWEPGLRRRVEAESRRLAALAGEVPLVFGTARPAPSGRLWNELWWCERGELRQVVRKRALPSYDVFDESRYFEPDPSPQPLVAFRGHRIGLSICEDLWADPELGNAPVRYGLDPVADLAAAGATLLLNASASPSGLGSYLPHGRTAPWAVPSKDEQRRRLIPGTARKFGVPVAYASRVGAESWLLFDGGSGLAHPDGRWQGMEPFAEGMLLVDTDTGGGAWRPCEEAPWLRRALVTGIRDNLAKQGLEGLVLGMSGGIDSAVCAALAVEALGPGRVLGVSMPTRFSSSESGDLAEVQARHLGMSFLSLHAELPFAGFSAALDQAFPGRAFGLTDENLQSRSRGALVMALTTEPEVQRRLGTGRIAVLNTGNKSEAATGYFTLYGDGIGAFAPLGDCLKARVYAVARELGDAVPRGVLERPPTAELRPGQTDEASLLPYAQLDAILGAALEAQRPEEGLAEDLALLLDGADLAQARAALPRILGLLRRTEFKRRQLPFAFKVSPKAFGAGRRIPLTAL